MNFHDMNFHARKQKFGMAAKALDRALATLAAIASSSAPRALLADRNLHQV